MKQQLKYQTSESLVTDEIKEKAKNIVELLSNKTVEDCKEILYLVKKIIYQNSVLKV